jgi:hypothetical protein
MTTSAYMLIALIIAGGSCQEPRIIVQKMASLELCQAAANLATKGGGRADCVPVPPPNAGVSSPNAGVTHSGAHHWRAKRSNSDAGAEEVQQLNRAQLGDR